jgi:nitrate/nitrite transport system substrate-binding protein
LLPSFNARKHDVGYLAVAKQINQIDIYKDAAGMAKVNVPRDSMRSARLADGALWDGRNPQAYAASFNIKA